MKMTENKAIVYTMRKANSNYGVMGKYIVIDSVSGKLLINAIYNYYPLAKKNCSLYNKNQLSASDILNIR
jgi:hypothetical protein